MRRLILALALILLPQIAWAACANTWTVKDGAGASQTFCRGSDGGTNLISYFSILDSAGVNAAAVTAANALKVDGSAITQPVSGTFWQATQPVSGTFFQATQPVSSTTLALEAGGNLAQLVTDSGAPGAVACATDTGSCSFNQLFQRIAQRLTTINTTLGSPFQAGGALAANQSVNVAQFGSSAVATGTGAGGAGIPRVTLSNDSSLAANQSVNVAQIGGTALLSDACQTVAKNYTPISITANTKIITGTSAKQTYICAINLTAPNTNVALVEGTGSTCATSTAGMAGGATAATGWIFANATAPGVGLVQGNGAASVMRTATNADDVCLFLSAANQVSGHIVWVQL